MTCALNDSVAAMKEIHLEGNIIPMEWFVHLKFDSGKPDMNAILILSDIVYWYRPVIVRDEQTGMVTGYRKKFKSDLLQKSYQQYADLFGLSKRQVSDAIIRLEEKGLVNRVFRNVETPSLTLPNILFLALNVENLREINGSVGGVTIERDTPPDRKGDLPRSNVTPPPIKREYTEITPKTPTETTTHTLGARADVSIQMLEIWNEALKPSCPVQMTSSRLIRLKAVLSGYFQDDLSRWQAFCEEITRSAFLMGKGERRWHVSLDWILDPANLQKTLEGNYRDGALSSSRDKGLSGEESAQKAQEHVQQLSDPGLQRFSLGIIKALGASCYLSWFRDVQIRHEEDHRLGIVCPTRFIHDTIQSRFSQDVFSVATSLFPELEGVDYGVIPKPVSSSSPSLVSSQRKRSKRGVLMMPLSPPCCRPGLSLRRGSGDGEIIRISVTTTPLFLTHQESPYERETLFFERCWREGVSGRFPD